MEDANKDQNEEQDKQQKHKKTKLPMSLLLHNKLIDAAYAKRSQIVPTHVCDCFEFNAFLFLCLFLLCSAFVLLWFVCFVLFCFVLVCFGFFDGL